MKNKGLSIVIVIFIILGIDANFGIRISDIPVYVSIYLICSAYVVYVLKKYIEK